MIQKITRNKADIVSLLKGMMDNGISVFLEEEKLKLKAAKNQHLDSELLETLKQKKNEIISFLKNEAVEFKNVNNKSPFPAIQNRKKENNIPVSFSQQSLWTTDHFSGSSEYHMPAVFKFKGALNLNNLEAAFNAIVNRHEVLRTIYVERNGEIFQDILSKNEWRFDSLGEPQVIDEKDLERYVNEVLSQPFDLASDKMLRAKIYKVSADEYLLIVVLHHIAADGWSLPILMQEMVEFYEAFTYKRKAKLMSLPVQYADYAAWQKECFSNGLLEESLAYWESKLSNVTPINLPLDYPRPALQSTNGQTLKFTLSSFQRLQLEQLAKEKNVTLFMLLLASFKVLLHKYNSQSDSCIGIPVANRTQLEIEPLIGFFVNVLAIRTDLDGNPAFQELLSQVKSAVLEAQNNQAVPFEKIVSKIEKERDTSRSPVFQVMFKLQDELNTSNIRLENLELSVLPFDTNTSKFDLTMSISKLIEGGLDVELEYCSDLFFSERIEQMKDHFQNLINAILINPEERIDNYNILKDSERSKLLNTFNNTKTNYPEEATLADLFESQVLKSPNEVAVTFEKESITYQQLDSRANQIARLLLRKGLQKEDFVLLCLDRSIEMVISLLAVLKAGGAYIPLDPLYPENRIKHIIKDADAKYLISSSVYKNVFAEVANLSTIILDLDQKKINKESELLVSSFRKASNLAYAIYTSGSTGLPKGVMIEHRSLVNFLYSMKDILEVNSSSSLLAVTTYSFDISYLEIYMPLISGGQVIIASSEAAADGFALQGLLAKHKPTFLQATPATWRMLLNTDWKNKEQVVVLSGGEAIKEELKNSLIALSNQKVWNLYGPTETTIWSTTQELKKEEKVNIGRPIANTDIYIVENKEEILPNSLVPVGVIGELCIGGDGLARGYINRPELTDEKFTPNPFTNISTDRIYRTGDLARWLPDGTIECLGRKDHQVKIRGYRIELGEVNTILQKHPSILECVVHTQEDDDANKRLVAYIIGKAGLNTDEVRAYLNTKLPAYMVPAIIMELDEFPLTPNGKIDKKALPNPDVSSLMSAAYVAPETDLEKEIEAIWKEVLNIERIGVHDNFFALGGDSIIAVRISSFFKSKKYQIDARNIFEYPTIKELAGVITAQQNAVNVGGDYISTFLQKEEIAALKLLSVNSEAPAIYCVPGTGGEIASFYHLAEALRDELRLYAFQAYGSDGETDVLGSVEEMAAAYIKEMQASDPYGPYTLGGYCFGSKVIYEMALQLEERGFKVDQLVIFDVPAPHKNIPAKPTDKIEDYLTGIGDYVSTHLSIEYSLTPADFIGKDRVDQVDVLINYLKSKAINLSQEQINGFVNVGLSNANANWAYVPAVLRKLEVPVCLFKSTEKPFDMFEKEILKTQDYGWDEMSSQEVKVMMIKGDHDTFLRSPNVNEMATCLTKLLRERQSHRLVSTT